MNRDLPASRSPVSADGTERRVVVLGAGPAGLGAARELTKLGISPVVLEKRNKVGGLACTETFENFHFDMGGHRFFTKVETVRKAWHEMLGDDLLRRPRLSRIYYKRRFFYYPLRPLNALHGLGVREALAIVCSYIWWQLRPYLREDTFEQWVTNRFGRRLFQIFFKAYTEKVWGIPCSELRAEWAAQRIRDLSLKTALLSMLVKRNPGITTLIEEFDYPRLGPGMMWNAAKSEIERAGGQVRLNSDVVAICRTARRVDGVVVATSDGHDYVQGTEFISSIPITEVVEKLSPPPPPEVLEAARNLAYRNFVTVCLIVNKADVFPDNWIYVHSPDVKVGRVQNFKNWSAAMVPDDTKTSLGLEYFCTEGDALWNLPDADLVVLGKRELARIGLAQEDDVVDGRAFRIPKAYPVYDATYRDHLETVRAFVDGLTNLQTIGRNGLHRYNNQDHAMLTGILAARNVVLQERNDIWSVNADQEYHEVETLAADATMIEAVESVEAGLPETFEKLDRGAFGGAIGAAAGLVLFFATLILVASAGEAPPGPRLRLLAQYLPGYSVTLPGSLFGLGWGFIVGFVVGWTFALLRNLALWFSVALLRRRAELHLLRKLLDFM